MNVSHHDIIRKGADAWNQWRSMTPVQPDLRVADLSNLNLSSADLRLVDFRGASLAHVNMQGADLSDTRLEDTVLTGADLTNARGLLPEQLAGADLTNAILPAGVSFRADLEAQAGRALVASRVFLTTVAGCAYTWLTLATTVDSHLITNTVSSPLPILRTEVPIATFYLVSPILLLSLFLYLQINAQRLWESLARLPAVFPDGGTLPERAEPWLGNELLYQHIGRLETRVPPMRRLQRAIMTFLLYWLVPTTLLLLWWRYLTRHDGRGAGILIVMVCLSLVCTTWAARSRAASVDGRMRSRWRIQPLTLRSAASVSIAGLALSLMTVWACTSSTCIEDASHRSRRVSGSFLNTVTYAFQGLLPIADVRWSDLSSKPPGWMDSPRRVRTVSGARLRGTNLRGAFATGAFLANADLRYAELSHACFYRADLRYANMSYAKARYSVFENARFHCTALMGADLTGAVLFQAQADSADFSETVLTKTDFRLSFLRDADFSHARLDSVTFSEADLRDVCFYQASFRKVDFTGANLEGAKFHTEESPWERPLWTMSSPFPLVGFPPSLRGACLSMAKLPRVDLHGLDMEGADLTSAQLEGANLAGANLRNAELAGANIGHCDLRSAKGLTAAMVISAKNWHDAILDDAMRREVTRRTRSSSNLSR